MREYRKIQAGDTVGCQIIIDRAPPPDSYKGPKKRFWKCKCKHCGRISPAVATGKLPRKSCYCLVSRRVIRQRADDTKDRWEQEEIQTDNGQTYFSMGKSSAYVGVKQNALYRWTDRPGSAGKCPWLGNRAIRTRVMQGYRSDLIFLDKADLDEIKDARSLLHQIPKYEGLIHIDDACRALRIKPTVKGRIKLRGLLAQICPEIEMVKKPARRKNGRLGLRAYVPAAALEKMQAFQRAQSTAARGAGTPMPSAAETLMPNFGGILDLDPDRRPPSRAAILEHAEGYCLGRNMYDAQKAEPGQRNDRQPLLVLGDWGSKPVIRGLEVDPLKSRAQHKVVKAALEAGPDGLDMNTLATRSGQPSAHKLFADVRKLSAEWAGVLSGAGVKGGRYRVEFGPPFSTISQNVAQD